MIHCLTNLFFHVSLASPGTQQQACPSSRQGDVASQPHLSGEEWGRPALRPNHPGKRLCHPWKGELGSRGTSELFCMLHYSTWLPLATYLTSGAFPSAGLIQGRWQVAGRAPEALQQGSGPNTAKKEEQHAVVGDTRRPPERNFLHQRDQEAGGENQHQYMQKWQANCTTQLGLQGTKCSCR